MNTSKQNRRLKSLWYKKDIKGWIDYKFKIGRYPKLTTNDSDNFKEDMLTWNKQFTHEETQLKHYEDWNPYCCNNKIPCRSGAMNRMEKTQDGWKCIFCGLVIGKHLFRLPDNNRDIVIASWDNYEGRPITFRKSTRGCNTNIGRGIKYSLQDEFDINRHYIIRTRKNEMKWLERQVRFNLKGNDQDYINQWVPIGNKDRHNHVSGGNTNDEFDMPEKNVFKISNGRNKLENLDWVERTRGIPDKEV